MGDRERLDSLEAGKPMIEKIRKRVKAQKADEDAKPSKKTKEKQDGES